MLYDTCPICRREIAPEHDGSYICSFGHSRMKWWASTIRTMPSRIIETAIMGAIYILLVLVVIQLVGVDEPTSFVAGGLCVYFTLHRWQDSSNGIPQSVFNKLIDVDELPTLEAPANA